MLSPLDDRAYSYYTPYVLFPRRCSPSDPALATPADGPAMCAAGILEPVAASLPGVFGTALRTPTRPESRHVLGLLFDRFQRDGCAVQL
jgi:hypothetical protein